MTILLLGSGGREHALAWKIAQSPLCSRLFCAPGNPGTARCGHNVDVDLADPAAVVAFCQANGVEFVVIGPEAPLVAGLADDLAAAGVRAFGPIKAAAQLEGSKAFTKELCAAFDIPTAAFARFSDVSAAKAYLRRQGAPIVIKADGLAAGKGVVVAATVEEAEAAVDAMLGGSLGAAGREIVVEEFLEGEEASVFALCGGGRALPFGTAQDHKRAFDGDEGPNTGGMGAYSPAPIVTRDLERRIMDEIVTPTLRGLEARGISYTGVLYAGLMLTATGPKLIEYNVRFGDPEAQVLFPRLRSDLVEAMLAACDGRLDELDVRWSPDPALTVVLASDGYPGPVQKGSEIRGLSAAENLEGVVVFQAGTREEDGRILADGGRVLAVTATAATIADAQARAYRGVDRIDWPEGFCRRDIGWRALERERGSG